MQLDTDANFADSIQTRSIPTTEGGVGLTPVDGPAACEPSLIVKDDIPIDLRVKLIVSIIYLGMIPTEVSKCVCVVYYIEGYGVLYKLGL